MNEIWILQSPYSGIGDLPFLLGNIEVDADEDTLSLEVKVGDG
jgi:hypothetical protein